MNEFGGFWRRVLAYIIDTIILWVAFIPITLIFGLSTNPFDNTDVTPGLALGQNAISLVVGWLYFALLESSAKQATVGKMALGMVVTGEGGQRISFGRATGRYFGKILSALILLIGFIMVAFTAKKQGLHDMLASTLVLKGQPGQVGADPDVFA